MNRFYRQICKRVYDDPILAGGYVRISITAKCNMSCKYCHNEGQGDFSATMMPLDQVLNIVRGSQRFGFKNFRITGGEPLLHPELHQICWSLKEILKVPILGINTNASLFHKLRPIVLARLVDKVVVAMDHVCGEKSKSSLVGVPPADVMAAIVELKALKQAVSVACVYDGDFTNIVQVAEWCRSIGVPLKVLEVSNAERAAQSTEEFIGMVDHLTTVLGLRIGYKVNLAEYYGFDSEGFIVNFYHSHCRLRECTQCGRLHLRVGSEGRAKPCLWRSDTEVSLTSGGFDTNMRRALQYLGIPPEYPFSRTLTSS